MSWAVVFRIRQYLKGSLWVLPILGGTLGAVLAGLDDRLERSVQLPASWQYSASTASSALTSIVAATVALLGFVVTISVLVVQLATGTLSPRFMRLWYRDRMQKLVLAAFAGTFAFSYGLLRRTEQDSVPSIGVTAAGVAVGGSLLLFCSTSIASPTGSGRSPWRRRSPSPAARWSRRSPRIGPARRRPPTAWRGRRGNP